MKRVIIVRHAKSVHFGYDDDFHRDLTDRGIDDAERISMNLKDLNIMPDLIITSPATRTLHTAEIYCSNLNFNIDDIRLEEDLYEGISTQEFVDMLQELPDAIETVFVFGHNPTVYYLVYNMVKHFTSDMPTCSTVCLDFKVDQWAKVAAREAKIAFHLTPKNS